MSALDQFKNKQYLNLETFRRNGEGMKTPVWFVQDGESLYITTVANSGKVKRIRNNERVKITACKMDGKVTGTWMEAQAHEVTDLEFVTKVNQLFDKKYGLMKKLFDKQRIKKGVIDTILEIRLID
jgi:PPOX class probable F420-dependent enzyme